MFSLLKSLIKWMFIIYLIIGSLIWFASPFVADKYLKEFLIEHKLSLSDDTSIYYNPFTQHVSINELAFFPEGSEVASLSLKALDFELRLHQILFNNLYVSEFTIDGLHVAVDVNDNGYNIAGFFISNEPETLTEEIEEEVVETEPLPYQLVLPKFNLLRSSIDLTLNEHTHELAFNDFSLSGIKASLTQQLFDLTINSSIDKAPLNITFNGELLNETGDIAIDIQLTDLALERYQHYLPNQDDSLAGLLSLQISSNINVKQANQVTIDIPNYTLALNNLHVSSQGQQLTLSEQVFEGTTSKVTYIQPAVDNEVQNNTDDAATVTFNTQASYQLSDLNVWLQDDNEQLLTLESFSLPSITVDANNNDQNVVLSSVNLHNLVVSDRIDDEVLPLMTLAGIDIDEIQASPVGVAIGNVRLAGINVNAEINEQKELINLITLPESEEAESEEAQADVVEDEPSESSTNTVEETVVQSPEATAPFDISLNSFTLIEPISVQFTDKSVSPHFERDLTINTLNVSAIDSQSPTTVTNIVLQGTTGKYGKLDFNTNITPFDEVPVYHVKGFFNEFDLTGVSSYVRDALSIEIENGELDISIDTTVTDSELSGGGGILLRRFDFTGIESTTNKKNVNAMSFNAALGLLKDGDGNIELDLPLSGDVSDPDFGLSGLLTLVIKRATLSAAKDYLVTAFVPYASIVKVAVSAGELALKIRVEDLTFAPQVDIIEPEKQVFIEELGGLLKAKDDLQFKLCAYATPADIGLPLGTEVTVAEQITALNAISTKRVETLKDYLIQQHGIASSRLSICKNQIDTKEDAIPRITFDS